LIGKQPHIPTQIVLAQGMRFDFICEHPKTNGIGYGRLANQAYIRRAKLPTVELSPPTAVVAGPTHSMLLRALGHELLRGETVYPLLVVLIK
jgi:hypothetical protein